MKKLILALAIVVVAAVAAWFVFAKRGGLGGGEGAGDDGRRPSLIADAQPSAVGQATDAKKRKIRIPVQGGFIEVEEDDDDDMAPEDQKRMEAINEAMADDNFSAVTALIADVQTSTNAEVRGELVDALGSFGKKSLVELLPFMADPDADVAENAISQWTMALGEIKNEATKCKYIESAMNILTDEDALDSMMTELMDCDERLAIQTIVNIVASGTPQAVVAAKEQYEFITGEEYTNIADAETWLRENYEPQEAVE